MDTIRQIFKTKPELKVFHDLQTQILEILSLFRVINNYYYKKDKIQEQVKPLILQKFRKEIQLLQDNKNWLFGLPAVLNAIGEDFINKNDSFRFPDSIVLFEAWINLGLASLYPQIVFHFKFPGLLKNERIRHIFQFIFSTSRGLAFPIYYPPYFYGYNPEFIKYFSPLFKWIWNVCHWINQLIFLLEKKFNTKRHHPGEFESVIISEYENKVFKGIDTLFHGYFTNEPKNLGKYSSLDEVLQAVTFCYRIGDHAMNISIDTNNKQNLKVPLIDNEYINTKYEVDFFSYIQKLMEVNTLLSKKINFYRHKRKNLINELPLLEKIKFQLNKYEEFFILGKKLPERFQEIELNHKNKHLIENLQHLLWITPLFTHTIHDPARLKESFKFLTTKEDLDEFEYELTSRESIFFSYIKSFEKRKEFKFLDNDVIIALKSLRDLMAKMWLYFKERHFKSAILRLNKLANISLDNPNYKKEVLEDLKLLIPIIAIYEIFTRPLSQSVYPESVPQTKRLGAYLAKFLTSRYNIVGLNLIKFFNKLAFKNWAYLIVQKGLNITSFYNFVLKLPIWKHIPDKILDMLVYDEKSQ